MKNTKFRDDLLSIVIPCKNEEGGLGEILPLLRRLYPKAEIIAVNDSSTDGTVKICRDCNVTVISHPYSMGNGASIKTGARAAKGEILVFMDADGQHNPADIDRLLSKLDEGYDMVVGARANRSHASFGRRWANAMYNRLASWMTGQRIEDLTCGFRAVKANKFREFLHLLPNGFSYPTTITMAFFRAGYSVSYVPIEAARRVGASHIKPARDGFRFVLIILRIGTLYSPLKLFLPISVTFFLVGIAYYMYTFLMQDRFTNMSALLLSTSVLIFLIGLVSEQITNLLYTRRSD